MESTPCQGILATQVDKEIASMVDTVTDFSELLPQTVEDDPARALRASAELRRELEREQEGLVHRARVAGLSWAEVAECLGVTRQAVHKKYAGGGRLRRR